MFCICWLKYKWWEWILCHVHKLCAISEQKFTYRLLQRKCLSVDTSENKVSFRIILTDGKWILSRKVQYIFRSECCNIALICLLLVLSKLSFLKSLQQECLESKYMFWMYECKCDICQIILRRQNTVLDGDFVSVPLCPPKILHGMTWYRDWNFLLTVEVWQHEP